MKMERNNSSSNTENSSTEKKAIRLFGIELDPCHDSSNQHRQRDEQSSEGGEESTNSSASSIVMEKTHKVVFECVSCHKVFANSQALGGHQNAHKRERSMKINKRQLARKVATNYSNNSDFSYYASNLANWFHDHQSNLQEGIQISFCDDISRWYDREAPYQEDHVIDFSLTNVDRSSKAIPVSSPKFKKICSREKFDLQLGLG